MATKVGAAVQAGIRIWALARLIQELPEDQVPGVPADVRRRLKPAPEGTWPPAWFGMVESGRSETARQVDEVLAEGFGRS